MKIYIKNLLMIGFIISVFVLITACGGGGGSDRDGGTEPTPTVDVRGTWDGTWHSSVYGNSSIFTANIIQQGSNLSGTIDIPYIGMSGTNLKGTVKGSTITFGDIADQITFTGTISGDSSSSGTYTYPSMSDSGTWQGTKRSASGTCINIAGTWNITENLINTNCSDTTQTDHSTFTFTQNGCNFNATDNKGGTYSGTINNNQFSMTGSHPDSGGITTITSTNVTVSGDGNSVNGTASWTWSDRHSTCSGTTQISGTRAF